MNLKKIVLTYVGILKIKQPSRASLMFIKKKIYIRDH